VQVELKYRRGREMGSWLMDLLIVGRGLFIRRIRKEIWQLLTILRNVKKLLVKIPPNFVI